MSATWLLNPGGCSCSAGSTPRAPTSFGAANFPRLSGTRRSRRSRGAWSSGSSTISRWPVSGRPDSVSLTN